MRKFPSPGYDGQATHESGDCRHGVGDTSGNRIDSVWERLLAGEEASATTISEEFAGRSYAFFAYRSQR